MKGEPLAEAKGETGPHILRRQSKLGTSAAAYISEPSSSGIQKTTTTLKTWVKVADV